MTDAEKIETLEDKLRIIRGWCDAYPLKVFPEPSKADWKRAHYLLEKAGLTLDAISASNMRHVLDGIRKIIDD